MEQYILEIKMLVFLEKTQLTNLKTLSWSFESKIQLSKPKILRLLNKDFQFKKS